MDESHRKTVYYEENCFEEDVFVDLVGKDPKNQSSKPRIFSVERARRLVNIKYSVCK